jgi:hypothetical protein
VNGSVEAVQAARNWLASRRPWFWFLRPCRTVPAELLYVADDKDLRRLGRRRMFLALWLPAILAFLLVAVANCFVAEYDVKVWYYSSKDPLRKPLKTETEREDERLCASHLHLDLNLNLGVLGLFSRIPAHWVKVREWTFKRIRFDPPPEPDFVSFVLACPPLLAVIGGHLPCRLLLSRWMKRSSKREGLERLGRSVQTASLHLTASAGLALWSWLLPVFLLAMPTHTLWARAVDTLGPMMLVAPIVLWVLTNGLIWGRIRSLDRASRVLPGGPQTAPGLIVLSLLGAAIAYIMGRFLAG